MHQLHRALRPSSRLRELFAAPRFPGSIHEWLALRNTPVLARGNADTHVVVPCPYCTWLNTCSACSGHCECDGPSHSKFTARGRLRPEWTRYDCPGFTLRIVD